MKFIFPAILCCLFPLLAPAQTDIQASLPDTSFDVFVYMFHPEQAQQAEKIFTGRLNSLLRETNPDSLELAVCYRRLGVAQHILSKRAEAKSNFGASLRLLYNMSPAPEAELAKSLHNYGITLARPATYDSAFWCLEKSVEINRRLYGPLDERVAFGYCFLAGYSINIAKFTQGLEYAKTAVSILQHCGRNNHPYMVRALQIRGTLYQEKDNFGEALRDFSSAERIAGKTLDPLHPLLTNIYSAKGRLLLYKGDYEGAFDYLKRCLTIREQTLGPDHELTGNTSMSLGEVAFELRDTAGAVRYYERNFEIQKKNAGELPLDRYPFVMGLYRKIGHYEKVEAAFDHIRRHFTINDFTRKDIAYCYGEYAKMLLQQHRYQESIDWWIAEQELLQIQNPDEPTVLNYNLLSIATCQRMLGRFDDAEANTRRILEGKVNTDVKKQTFTQLGEIELARFQQSREPNDLRVAWDNFRTALHFMDSMRFEAPAANSRLQQSELNYHIFDKAMQTAALRGQVEDGFWLSEKSKTQALLEDLQHNDAILSAQVPDSLRQLEKQLKTDIADLEQRVFKKKTNGVAGPDEAVLFERKRTLFALLQVLETKFPDYYHLKYNVALPPVATLQQRLLDDSTALIEYFTSDSIIYIFTLTRHHLSWHRLPQPAGFEKTIRDLRKSITDSRLRFLGEDFALFSNCSQQLYDYLLAPPLSALPAQVQHLIVVADGLLNYVPFEVLGKITSGEAPDFRTFPYLLRRYNVSYAGSANLLLEQTNQLQKLQSEPAPALFAGFAPGYADSDTLRGTGSLNRMLLVREGQYGLPGAAQEVKEISALMNGHAFLDTQADELNFKRLSPGYRVLHLAMHALMDDRNPLFSRLLFTQNPQDTPEDNELTAIELYTMNLSAELVVLSACNTAAGRLYKGEGVMNLARAFQAAGAPATIVSLWQAPDEATRRVMILFYQYLKQGENKDSALRQAKLDFIAACKNPALANPFFWAGFIANGTMMPLARL